MRDDVHLQGLKTHLIRHSFP